MTTPIETIRQEIARLRAIEEKSTPGPWSPERYDSDNGYIHFSVNDSEMQQVCFCHEDMHPKTYRSDAKFIAESRAMEIMDTLLTKHGPNVVTSLGKYWSSVREPVQVKDKNGKLVWKHVAARNKMRELMKECGV